MNPALDIARTATAPTLAAKAVLLLIAMRHHIDSGRCVPSPTALQAETGLSAERLATAINMLTEADLLQKVETGEGRPPAYIVKGPKREALPAPGRQPHAGAGALPAEDWTPSPKAIEEIRKEFPHHDTSDARMVEITREWVDYSRAHGRTYFEPEAAWRNNARRAIQRGVSAGARPAYARQGGSAAGGVSGAVAGVRNDPDL